MVEERRVQAVTWLPRTENGVLQIKGRQGKGGDRGEFCLENYSSSQGDIQVWHSAEKDLW